MSSLEKRLQQFDISNGIDFEGYLDGRESDIQRIKHAQTYYEQVLSHFHGDGEELSGAKLPWAKTHQDFRFREGEVSTYVGYNGHGKSMITSHIAYDLIAQDHKVLLMSFEMRPASVFGRMARQACSTRNPSISFIDQFFESMKDKMYFFDQHGSVTPKRVMGVIYYAAENLGIKHFFVDSLMKVVANEDDMNGQKKLVDSLCAAARELNIHVHLIHHSRKREDETKRPGKQDAKGSGAIVDQTDNFFVLHKVPSRQDTDISENTHVLYLDKQRNGEVETGYRLWFDGESLQFKESFTTQPHKYFFWYGGGNESR